MNRRADNNNTPSQGSLSEKQQLLLSRFHDGECSFISAFVARRLISRNPEALNFLSDLSNLKNYCSRLDTSSRFPPIDLWERIDTRIEQEQRSALYLGTRTIDYSEESLWQRLSLRHAVVGGLSGAAIAVALLVVVSRPSHLMTFSAPAAGPATGNQMVQPVGIGATSAPRSQFQVKPARAHNPLEVDWMRANGSLKLIPDPSGSSAIIWVRRRPIAPSISPTEKTSRLARPTPLGLAVAESETQRHQLDGQRQTGAK
jgi:hypothetical protein